MSPVDNFFLFFAIERQKKGTKAEHKSEKTNTVWREATVRKLDHEVVERPRGVVFFDRADISS